MPERLECEVLQQTRYINPLTLPYLIQSDSQQRLTLASQQVIFRLFVA